MQLTRQQMFGIAIVVLSVLIGSTAQLTDLFGSGVAKIIISFATMANSILGGVQTIMGGQQGQVRDVMNTTDGGQKLLDSMLAQPGGQDTVVRQVLNMPGVDKVDVNEKASPELAQLAIDSTVNKISPTPEAMDAVTKTAEGPPTK